MRASDPSQTMTRQKFGVDRMCLDLFGRRKMTVSDGSSRMQIQLFTRAERPDILVPPILPVVSGCSWVEAGRRNDVKTAIVSAPEQIGAYIAKYISDRLKCQRPTRRIGRRVINRLDRGQQQIRH